MTGSTFEYSIELDGQDRLAKVLGELKSKSPAAVKVTLNATARRAKKVMIAKAKARYAVNQAGARHLKDLSQKSPGKKATNSDLTARLYISSYRNDLGYFKHRPAKALTGKNAITGPEYFKGKVLKSESLKALTGKEKLSKGFLIEFKSGHVGMVQRLEGSQSKFTRTQKSGAPRWTNKEGKVEKVQTMGSPSAAAMHRVVWAEAEPEVREYMTQRLEEQMQKVLARAAAKAKTTASA